MTRSKTEKTDEYILEMFSKIKENKNTIIALGNMLQEAKKNNTLTKRKAIDIAESIVGLEIQQQEMAAAIYRIKKEKRTSSQNPSRVLREQNSVKPTSIIKTQNKATRAKNTPKPTNTNTRRFI